MTKEELLRSELIRLTDLIYSSSKHIDNDFLKSEPERKYSISILAKDLSHIRVLKKAIDTNKI